MIKKIKFIVFFLLSFVFFNISVNADEIVINIHKDESSKIENAILIDGTTMVPIRAMAEILDMEIVWLAPSKTIVLFDDNIEFKAIIDKENAYINSEEFKLTKAPVLVDSLTYLPLRSVAEALNTEVIWNNETRETDVYIKKDIEQEKTTESKEITEDTNNNIDIKNIFYSQRESQWGFEGNGNGYCWVCCYAMAITSAINKPVTPDMIVKVNKKKGGGAYVQHGDIINTFGVTFTLGVDSSSPYFEKYDAWRGATYLKNSTYDEAINALKAALDKNPQGIMVRYSIYPHTLFAVGYDNDNIYFNEPAYINSKYVTFENTCLKKYNIADFDYIQAVKKKD